MAGRAIRAQGFGFAFGRSIEPITGSEIERPSDLSGSSSRGAIGG
jgi:hypothetical protein